MADVTTSEVMAALAVIVKAGDPKARVITSDVLGIEEGGSLDAYRSDDDDQRIHAWKFTRTQNRPRLPDGAKPAYYPPHAKRTVRLDKTWTITFRFYLGYAVGSNEANAELEASDLIDSVQKFIAKKVKLGMANDLVRGHGELQQISLRTIPANDQSAVSAVCTLDILIHQSVEQDG